MSRFLWFSVYILPRLRLMWNVTTTAVTAAVTTIPSTTSNPLTTNQCHKRLYDPEMIVGCESQWTRQTVQDGAQFHRAEHLGWWRRRRPGGRFVHVTLTYAQLRVLRLDRQTVHIRATHVDAHMHAHTQNITVITTRFTAVFPAELWFADSSSVFPPPVPKDNVWGQVAEFIPGHVPSSHPLALSFPGRPTNSIRAFLSCSMGMILF